MTEQHVAGLLCKGALGPLLLVCHVFSTARKGGMLWTEQKKYRHEERRLLRCQPKASP